ncbi:MAG: 50S ribosomal protein L11 methyltransferase, partial [Clostridia bacterium]|nr:50S ribosomal protein L11 methyltransferase [Clostridia bacterium]
MKYTASLVKLNIDERLRASRKQALLDGVPVADDETLQFLLVTLATAKPKRILEIGTAVGLSGVAMLQACPNARLTTIELEEERHLQALRNFSDFGVVERVTAYLGDAGEILAMMDGEYDFVCANIVADIIIRMAPDVGKHMKKGGLLVVSGIIERQAEDAKA